MRKNSKKIRYVVMKSNDPLPSNKIVEVPLTLYFKKKGKL